VRDLFAAQGANTERWFVIPYGLDAPQSTPPVAADGPLRVAYVGSIAPAKGVHLLIEAFGACSRNAILKLAGDPATFPDYVARLRLQDQRAQVQFCGALDRSKVWQLLAGSDVAVVPSLVHETANLAAREAVAAGCWLIASRLGALTELLDARHDLGELVAPRLPDIRDALLRAQNNLHGIRAARANRLKLGHPLALRTPEQYAQEISHVLRGARE
jgi:glycosyltransferase involved in cell wall biosynthesis